MRSPDAPDACGGEADKLEYGGTGGAFLAALPGSFFGEGDDIPLPPSLQKTWTLSGGAKLRQNWNEVKGKGYNVNVEKAHKNGG